MFFCLCICAFAKGKQSMAATSSLLQELTCYMGSQSVTCHPAEVTFPPLPQPKLVLGLLHPGVDFLFIIVCNLAQTL